MCVCVPWVRKEAEKPGSHLLISLNKVAAWKDDAVPPVLLAGESLVPPWLHPPVFSLLHGFPPTQEEENGPEMTTGPRTPSRSAGGCCRRVFPRPGTFFLRSRHQQPSWWFPSATRHGSAWHVCVCVWGRGRACAGTSGLVGVLAGTLMHPMQLSGRGAMTDPKRDIWAAGSRRASGQQIAGLLV